MLRVSYHSGAYNIESRGLSDVAKTLFVLFLGRSILQVHKYKVRIGRYTKVAVQALALCSEKGHPYQRVTEGSLTVLHTFIHRGAHSNSSNVE